MEHTNVGERVIRLSESEFTTLLLMMGYATGAASKESDKGLGLSFLRIANAVNRDNPDWTPYELAE